MHAFIYVCMCLCVCVCVHKCDPLAPVLCSLAFLLLTSQMCILMNNVWCCFSFTSTYVILPVMTDLHHVVHGARLRALSVRSEMGMGMETGKLKGPSREGADMM